GVDRSGCRRAHHAGAGPSLPGAPDPLGGGDLGAQQHLTRRLVVAMADPSNVFAIDDIRTITGAEVRTVVATKAGIQEAIDKHHRLDSDAENITAQASSEFEPEEDLSAVKDVVEDAPIVKLVNVLITQAVADRASDIHIEPTEVDVRVRYRIDGVLHEVMRSPTN